MDMTDNELAIELQTLLDKPYETIRRTETYKVIRWWAESRGHWTHAPRGNPAKGWRLGYGKPTS